MVARLTEQPPTEAASPAEAEAGAPAEVTLHLPSRPDSPMTARHSLAGIEQRVDPETMAKLRLLITELVANSVRHARGTPIDVSVKADDALVRAVVSDGGDGFDVPHDDPNPMKTTGWGLVLVRKIASRWGVEHHTGTVWFELQR